MIACIPPFRDHMSDAAKCDATYYGSKQNCTQRRNANLIIKFLTWEKF